MFTITLTIEADDLVSLAELLPQLVELAPNDVRITGCHHDYPELDLVPDQADPLKRIETLKSMFRGLLADFNGLCTQVTALESWTDIGTKGRES